MKKSDGTKIEVIKENPVAKALMGNRYRMKVKGSKKLYRRSAQKQQMQSFLKNGNGPMRLPICSVG